MFLGFYFALFVTTYVTVKFDKLRARTEDEELSGLHVITKADGVPFKRPYRIMNTLT